MREFEGSPSPAEYINIMVDESSIISKIEHYEKQKVEISKWIRAKNDRLNGAAIAN